MLCGGKICVLTDEGAAEHGDNVVYASRCRNKTCRRRKLDPAVLVKLPLFDGIAPERVMELLFGAAVETHPPRTVLFDARAPAESFFILLSGGVKLMAISSEGKESIVEIARPVSSFAEAAIFASAHYPVSAETLEESDLIRVRASSFLAALRDHPDLARRMLASLHRWNRRLCREWRALRAQSPAQRVAGFLYSLAPEGEGEVTLTLPFKKAVLASRLGMEPESLSRVLARLRERGVESKARGVITIDRPRLRAFLDGGPSA